VVTVVVVPFLQLYASVSQAIPQCCHPRQNLTKKHKHTTNCDSQHYTKSHHDSTDINIAYHIKPRRTIRHFHTNAPKTQQYHYHPRDNGVWGLLQKQSPRVT
jgi:hypothetical protein